MNADRILQCFTENVTPLMHKIRRKALTACVQSLLHGSFARVTAIGRGISSSAYEKHSIKRADRLLSNKYLDYETLGIYREMAKCIVSERSQPVILAGQSPY